MNYAGTLLSHGAPLCISRADVLSRWLGARTRLNREHDLLSTVVNREGIRYAIVRACTDRVAVFASREAFVLVEVPYTPDRFDLAESLFGIEDCRLEPDILRLGGLGAEVVIFPAGHAGSSILKEASDCLGSVGRGQEVFELATAARLPILPGRWTASLFAFDHRQLVLRGVWFQHESVSP